MQQSTKASLLMLARSGDPRKALFSLTSLAREDVDSDFNQVLDAILHGLRSVSSDQMAEDRDDFYAALHDFVRNTGIPDYVRAIARQEELAPHLLEILFGPVRSSWPLVDAPIAALLDIATTPGLDDDTICWLAVQAASVGQSGQEPDLIRPLVKRYGQDPPGELALADAATAFLASPQASDVLRSLVAETSGSHLAGDVPPNLSSVLV